MHGLWWSKTRLFMMVSDGFWWFLMVSDGFWWFMGFTWVYHSENRMKDLAVVKMGCRIHQNRARSSYQESSRWGHIPNRHGCNVIQFRRQQTWAWMFIVFSSISWSWESVGWSHLTFHQAFRGSRKAEAAQRRLTCRSLDVPILWLPWLSRFNTKNYTILWVSLQERHQPSPGPHWPRWPSPCESTKDRRAIWSSAKEVWEWAIWCILWHS